MTQEEHDELYGPPPPELFDEIVWTEMEDQDVDPDWEEPVYGNYEPIYLENDVADEDYELPNFDDFENVFSRHYFEPG